MRSIRKRGKIGDRGEGEETEMRAMRERGE